MKIVLKDGTIIVAEENEYPWGKAFDTQNKVEEAIFTEYNLSDVTIDGVGKGYMVLDFLSPDGLQFYLREPSKEEAQIHEVQAKVDEVTTEPLFVHVRAQQTGVTVPAGDRTNIKIPLVVPEGYTFGAYRGVALGGQGTGFHKCAFQMFDSSDGGTKANISITNFGTEDVTVDVNVTILFIREWTEGAR